MGPKAGFNALGSLMAFFQETINEYELKLKTLGDQNTDLMKRLVEVSSKDAVQVRGTKTLDARGGIARGSSQGNGSGVGVPYEGEATRAEKEKASKVEAEKVGFLSVERFNALGGEPKGFRRRVYDPFDSGEQAYPDASSEHGK